MTEPRKTPSVAKPKGQQMYQQRLILRKLLSKLYKDQDLDAYERDFRAKIGKMIMP